MKRTYQQLLLVLCLGFGSLAYGQSETSAQQFIRGQQAYQANDYERARKAFQPLAEAGNSKAQIYMGSMYDRGLGVERDIKQAFYWFEKSAEQGGVKLQYDLALRYLYGKGVARDYNKAHYWMQKAADAGAPQAQYNLGLMYVRGNGVEADNDKAVELFRLAADKNLRDAQYALGLAHITGQIMPLDYAEAYRLFRLSAEQGYPPAQYNLAALTESGEGTARDTDEAIIWYRKAAEQGHELARERLGELEDTSVFTPQPVMVKQSVSRASKIITATPGAKIIHDENWVKSQPASNYTIQISVSQDKQKLIAWLRSQQPLAPLAYFPQQQNGKVVYKAIYGSFDDQAAAQKALREMPEALVKLKPWVRGFASFHR